LSKGKKMGRPATKSPRADVQRRVWGWVIKNSNGKIVDTVKDSEYRGSRGKSLAEAVRLAETHEAIEGVVGSTGWRAITQPSPAGGHMTAVRNHLAEEKTAFEGGATRSAKTARYDLVPAEGTRAIAERYGVGAVKHGDNNWKQGGVEFIKATISHVYGHLDNLKATAGQAEDDDIGAIGWGATALAWFRVHTPEDYYKALGEIQ
jgi:hypothetical protein